MSAGYVSEFDQSMCGESKKHKKLKKFVTPAYSTNIQKKTFGDTNKTSKQDKRNRNIEGMFIG